MLESIEVIKRKLDAFIAEGESFRTITPSVLSGKKYNAWKETCYAYLLSVFGESYYSRFMLDEFRRNFSKSWHFKYS